MLRSKRCLAKLRKPSFVVSAAGNSGYGMGGADGAYYYKVTVTNGKGETTAETKKIGRSNLEIRYSADVSTTFDNASKLDASNPIKIEFDRSSGAEKTDIGKIWVKHGSTEKTITIYKETGKIECN